MKTEPIKEITDEISQLISDMFDTLYGTSNGVGLAANQVGKSLSLFIIDVSSVDEYKEMKPFVCINPQITDFSDETNYYNEGCLSAPNFFEEVERPTSITLTYFDKEMNENVLNADGFLARVLQHEYDHLDGVLFYDKLSAFKRTLNRSKLRKLRENEVDIDYDMIDTEGNLQKSND